ncbi:hypothetical protein PsorP6_006433 [Peronosclerospora sorghi]|uniref:Uncharacterized protein n=1 Tax=Peronosclerospora sorghi TaxID=230839 RepID=A0ACC0W5P4_9STRA|nr:hypothetical protein PsorP6_006433 [Peronosclerospora sorghi]
MAFWVQGLVLVSVVLLATAGGSNGAIISKNETSTPPTVRVTQRLPSSVSFTGLRAGDASKAAVLGTVSPSSTPSTPAPESRARAFASFFKTSAPPSTSPPSRPVSSIDGPSSITVSPSSSPNYSALVTDASGSAYALATPLTATSSVVQSYRNWVGPRTVQQDSACWREAHIMTECPSTFNRHKLTSTCWAQCPIEFPIQCGFECVRQNDDCGRAVFYKINSFINVGLNGIMDNWFGKFREMAKAVRTATMCSCMVLGEIRALLRYIRSVKASDPQISQDKLLAMLYQSNAVVVELPITIKLCMGDRAGPKWWLADRVMATTQLILSQVLAYDDELLTSFHRFKAFLTSANFTAPPEMITEGEIGYLTDALESNSTCGHDLHGLVERTWSTIETLREQYPGITKNELRVKLLDTDLVKTDIAIVTNNCMELLVAQSDEKTAYRTRDTIRKTFGVILNDLITKGVSNNGTSYEANRNTYTLLNTGLSLWVATGFDMSGISSLISEYFESICGPTHFIGEIDDGTHPDTLGLNAIGHVFQNSSLAWQRRGDGHVHVTFTSDDTKPVRVNILSGGKKIDEVALAPGATATWHSTVATLSGKTLYFDRWRRAFLGLPGTSGGSLMLWIPHAVDGGHLDLTVRLHPKR